MRGGLPTLLVSVFTAIALFALAGYQVTSETAGSRLLGRLAASLVELDRWVPAHREDIELLARDKQQGFVSLNDLPVEVELPAFVAVDTDDATLSDAITRIMGDRLYNEGTAAFRDAQGESRSLSAAEPVRWATGLLNKGMHGFWTAVLVLSLLVLLGLCASALMGGHVPLVALGAGAALSAVCSAAAWIAAQVVSGVFESAVDKEIMLIVRDGAFIGLRDSLAICAVVGALIFLLTLSKRDEASESWPDAPPSDQAPFSM
ncbi:MAG TPA: hypothetical protein VI759_09665 [Dehalococcoidia bacterium]|nr:hypothetical protein [Dehalococcoidia bacterium]